MLNSSTSFEGQSILALSQFSREGVETVLEVASGIGRLESRAVMPDILRGRLLITLFYEPSTRTRVSFQAAMLRLGGQAIDVGEIAHSSVAKGEDLEDTLRTLRQYADVIVLRHGEQGAM